MNSTKAALGADRGFVVGYGLGLLGLAIGIAAHAQTPQQAPPDAGSLQRPAEEELRRQRQLPQPAAPAGAASGAAPRVNQGPTLLVSRFAFEGNERFTEEQLTPVVAQYLQRRVTLAELELAAADVARYYRAAGWAARVIVPPQDIDQGVVRLKVIEGVLGRTRFSGATDTATLPVAPETIVGGVQSRVQPGEKLNISAVERGLLIVDDLPGLDLTGSQVAGSGEAQTDILLIASRTSSTFGEASLDNLGSRGTGATRATLRLGMNSPFLRGEQVDLMAQMTRYMRYLRIAGSLPLGSDGLRLSANASALRYRVGTPEFAALEPRGDSRNFGADLLYPLIRASDRNVYLDLAVENKQPYNTGSAGVLSDYDIRNVLLRLDANAFDALAAGGVTTLSLTAISGRVDLGDSPPAYVIADAGSFHVQGRFKALRYRLNRTQRLDHDLTLTASLNGQEAGRNLDSAEKFYLGGPYGVRAYPANEAGGSSGRMVNLDLRWKLPVDGSFAFELGAFYDWGRITLNADNVNAAGQTLSQLNRYSLSGYGVGLAIEGPRRIRLTTVVARRIGSNPGANPQTGLDQDGSLDRTRLWLTLGMSF